MSSLPFNAVAVCERELFGRARRLPLQLLLNLCFLALRTFSLLHALVDSHDIVEVSLPL